MEPYLINKNQTSGSALQLSKQHDKDPATPSETYNSQHKQRELSSLPTNQSTEIVNLDSVKTIHSSTSHIQPAVLIGASADVPVTKVTSVETISIHSSKSDIEKTKPG